MHVRRANDGLVLTRRDLLLSTHEDKENHGIGLDSVRTVLQKYDGSIEIEYDSSIFSVTLLKYVD